MPNWCYYMPDIEALECLKIYNIGGKTTWKH
jgi:hypothetical protein